ncbi:Arabidopsis thaliana BRAHMA ortholog, partial [Plasmodium yoelii yoelii]
NYNPIGFNESLIGMGKNDKKNITVYIPVNLFQDYFKNQQKKNDGNDSIITIDKDTKKDLENMNEISKDSINKFREIIYMEIKKLKNNKVFDKLESILKSNENKFFDNNNLEKYLKKDETSPNENDGKEEEITKKMNEKNDKTGEIYYLPNKEEDIEYILENDNEFDEEMENKETNVNDNDDELNFKKNFDKYLEEILKENMNSLDKKIPSYNNENSKTKEIFENLCDPNDYDKADDIDETLNDYILGKSDLIKCVLEVNVIDIKMRKSGTEKIDDYIFKKYNKTKDELYTEIENRAMIDIQNKCVEQRRMGAYKKLMEITSLNVPITLFRAQGKKLYANYLKKKEMQGKNIEENNNGTEKILTFEEFINKSQREIYDQIIFSFIVKSIFHNSKLKLNYDELIKEVIKTLIKTPTYNIKTIIKQIYTIHQAQCVLDFVSLNSNILHETDNSSSVNFS